MSNEGRRLRWAMVPVSILRDPALSHRDLRVLVALVGHSGRPRGEDRWEPRPVSQERLMRELGMKANTPEQVRTSLRVLQRAERRLAAAGYVTILPGGGRRGRKGLANRYDVNATWERAAVLAREGEVTPATTASVTEGVTPATTAAVGAELPRPPRPLYTPFTPAATAAPSQSQDVADATASQSDQPADSTDSSRVGKRPDWADGVLAQGMTEDELREGVEAMYGNGLSEESMEREGRKWLAKLPGLGKVHRPGKLWVAWCRKARPGRGDGRAYPMPPDVDMVSPEEGSTGTLTGDGRVNW
jgi:hypothetical protein